MFPYLVILFTVLPALELLLLINIGGQIGAFNTITVIILTGVLGASLARYQGFLVLNNIQTNMNKGVIPSEELLDGLMILVGGIVLLTPGFITDTLGLLLLIPLTRNIFKSLVKTQFTSMVNRGQTVQFSSFHKPSNHDDDIVDI